MKAIEDFWNPIDCDDPATFPPDDGYVLLSLENCAIPMIGRCKGSPEDGYSVGLVVNAWMPLLKCYRDEEER